ncbi:GTP cyclohydrolase II RibA [Martelella soudanensis]|uniref:GTP cyclohydrolase II RibA n=1 Tax=unclassified Martelella TaxID=2629616 RepID=UPI0015E006E8|nr:MULTISPECIES: GTP cyclohydrolase II RibA [unclassified Martelella]
MEVERAVAELRFGRPVILRHDAQKLAVLALDCASPATYDAFAVACDDRHALFLTARRAHCMGISSGIGIAAPAAGLSFDAASRLSYALDARAPAQWREADPAMEAAAELARMSLLLPAMVCAEIDGIEERFAACQRLDCGHLAGSASARQEFAEVVRTRVPLKELGDAQFAVFRGGLAQKDQIAIIVGEPDLSRPVSVRIHSSCLTGDLCGSLKCDCGDQLRNGLANLRAAGGGVLIYLDQEGRGTGIGSKMRAYGYQHQGLDTIDADAELGLEPDHRRYEAAVAILRLLGISSVVLHTNNPTKIAAINAAGITVAGRVPTHGKITEENLNYLRTKALRADHIIDPETLVTAK